MVLEGAEGVLGEVEGEGGGEVPGRPGISSDNSIQHGVGAD